MLLWATNDATVVDEIGEAEGSGGGAEGGSVYLGASIDGSGGDASAVGEDDA